MLLNSVILVLQETLEAALLISVLLTISLIRSEKITWLPLSLFGGLLFSVAYAHEMATISLWFDFVGQEVFNALLQLLITLLISVCVWSLVKLQKAPAPTSGQVHRAALFPLCAGLVVVLAMTREGTEILLYLDGFLQQQMTLATVITGSLIGFGIGISTGVLLYYSLQSLPSGWCVRVVIILLTLFAANMLSQAALLLSQADWVSGGQALWDSSAWLSETSISGKLLYALIGYEATPSAFQVLAYLVGAALVSIVATIAWITTRLPLPKSSE